jgi:hypothetical protein
VKLTYTLKIHQLRSFDQLPCQSKDLQARRGNYKKEVDAVIHEQSRNPERIERLIDGMLDFCFDKEMLVLYKKICRYYFAIDPDTTVSYIYAYRDMWDNEGGGQDE